MVWEGISIEGHIDLYRLGKGNLTAIRYQDEIIVRPYTGTVDPRFLLVYDNGRMW